MQFQSQRIRTRRSTSYAALGPAKPAGERVTRIEPCQTDQRQVFWPGPSRLMRISLISGALCEGWSGLVSMAGP